FLAMTGDVRVISKRSGSVKLTLEVNHDQAARLLRAIRAGVFAEFGATDARVIEQKAVSHAVGAIEQAVVSGSFEPKMPEEPKRPAGPSSSGYPKTTPGRGSSSWGNASIRVKDFIINISLGSGLRAPVFSINAGETPHEAVQGRFRASMESPEL